MKKICWSFLALICFFPSIARAINPPEIFAIPEVVDASTYTIQGQTEPLTKITATGEAYEIPPVIANDQGVFEIRVGLTQESINVFYLTAEKDKEMSSATQVLIKEGQAAALEYQTRTGKDVIAPDAPVIQDIHSPINSDVVEISGITEPSATIKVTKTDGSLVTNTRADADGNFDLCLELPQNTISIYGFLANDQANNTSPIVQIKIMENETGPLATFANCNTENTIVEKKSTSTPPPLPPFTDINQHWAKEYIMYLFNLTVISGKTNTSFAPDHNITRAELTKIALLAFNYSLLSNITIKPFSDVELNSWYTSFVATAKDLKIISGYADNTFRPNNSISRAEALKIILALSKLDIGDGLAVFSDTDESAWYSKYIAYAKENNIIKGYGDNTFRPNNFITRAEVAKIVTEILKKLAPENTQANTTDNGATPNNGEPPVASDYQLYTNAVYKFRFQFNKNWYYSWIDSNSDEIIVFLQLSDKDPRAEELIDSDILIKVVLKKGVAPYDDGYSELLGDIYKIYKQNTSDSYFEIYGDNVYEKDINTIAKTLETKIVIENDS